MASASVYVVYFHSRSAYGPFEKHQHHYTIHRLGISSSPEFEFEFSREPLLTLDADRFPLDMGFASSGSKIYMFGGYCGTFPSLDLYILDAGRLDSSSSASTDHFIRRGPSLKSPKIRPIVISLLGKIYAISTSLERPNGSFGGSWAEVFDLSSHQWDDLPTPTNVNFKEFDAAGAYKVQYCDVFGSLIVLTMRSGMIYQLDCNNLSAGWSGRHSRFLGLPKPFSPYGSSDLVNNIYYPWFSINGDRATSTKTALVGYKADKSTEPIYIRGENIGTKITMGKRRVLDIGNDLMLVISTGFKRNTRFLAYGYGKLRFTFDIVKLQDRKRKRSSNTSDDNIRLRCNPVKSQSFVIADLRSGGSLCGCFLMRDETHGPCPLPYVSWY